MEGLGAHQLSPWPGQALADPVMSVHFPGEATEAWQGLGLFTADMFVLTLERKRKRGGNMDVRGPDPTI